MGNLTLQLSHLLSMKYLYGFMSSSSWILIVFPFKCIRKSKFPHNCISGARVRRGFDCHIYSNCGTFEYLFGHKQKFICFVLYSTNLIQIGAHASLGIVYYLAMLPATVCMHFVVCILLTNVKVWNVISWSKNIAPRIQGRLMIVYLSTLFFRYCKLFYLWSASLNT